MNAILLAAGLGTRLKPLTDTTPKCMVNIKGQPLLKIWLEKLGSVNINSVLINTHYLSEKVESFVNNTNFVSNVSLSYEETLLGTAGTLLKHLDFYEGNDGLLIHADNYSKLDLNNLIQEHYKRPDHCLFTMVTFCTDNPQNCGIVTVDKMGVINSFHEKKSENFGNIANGAIYCLSKEFIQELYKYKNEKIFDFSTQIIPKYVGKIYSYHTDEILIDIGTPLSYQRACSI